MAKLYENTLHYCNLILVLPVYSLADQNEGAWQVYAAIQDNTKINEAAININCGDNVSNKKVFQYTGSNNSTSIYESSDVTTVTITNTTIKNYYPVQVPYYFGAPYFYND